MRAEFINLETILITPESKAGKLILGEIYRRKPVVIDSTIGDDGIENISIKFRLTKKG